MITIYKQKRYWWENEWSKNQQLGLSERSYSLLPNLMIDSPLFLGQTRPASSISRKVIAVLQLGPDDKARGHAETWIVVHPCNHWLINHHHPHIWLSLTINYITNYHQSLTINHKASLTINHCHSGYQITWFNTPPSSSHYQAPPGHSGLSACSRTSHGFALPLLLDLRHFVLSVHALSGLESTSPHPLSSAHERRHICPCWPKGNWGLATSQGAAFQHGFKG